MPSQRVLFTSDLHARRELYQELVRCAERLHPGVVLLGGDLFEGEPAAQASFARGPFFETLQRLRDAGVEIVGVLPGNDDWTVALDALHEREVPGLVRWLADEPIELADEINVLGYPYVPLSPFTVKDHEKLDHYRPDKQDVLESVATGVGTYQGGVGGVTKPTDGSESIERDLRALAAQVRPGRTLFVSHCPPRNTRLDFAYGRHAGSQAVREFLETTRPAMSLHGHILEIDQRGGVFAEWVGETLAVNPGQGASLHAVHFDAAEPVETLAHTLLGRWQPARAVPAADPQRG